MSMVEMKIKYLICTIITTEPIKHKAQHDNMRGGGGVGWEPRGVPGVTQDPAKVKQSTGGAWLGYM